MHPPDFSLPISWFRLALCAALTIGSTAFAGDKEEKRHNPCVLGFTSHQEAAGPAESRIVETTTSGAKDLESAVDELRRLLREMLGSVSSASASPSLNPLAQIKLALKEQVIAILKQAGDLTFAPQEFLKTLAECLEKFKKIEELEAQLKSKGLDLDAGSSTNVAARAAQDKINTEFGGLQAQVETATKTPRGRLESKLDSNKLANATKMFGLRLGLTVDEFAQANAYDFDLMESPPMAVLTHVHASSDNKWVFGVHNWPTKNENRFVLGDEAKVIENIGTTMIHQGHISQVRSYRQSGLIEDSAALTARITDDFFEAAQERYIPRFVYAYDMTVFLYLARLTNGFFELARVSSSARRRVIHEAIPAFFEALMPSASICFEINALDPNKNRISKWYTNNLPDPLFLTRLNLGPNLVPSYTPVPSKVTRKTAYLALAFLLQSQSLWGSRGSANANLQAYAHTSPHERMYTQMGMKSTATVDNPRWGAKGVKKMEGTISAVFGRLSALEKAEEK